MQCSPTLELKHVSIPRKWGDAHRGLSYIQWLMRRWESGAVPVAHFRHRSFLVQIRKNPMELQSPWLTAPGRVGAEATSGRHRQTTASVGSQPPLHV